MRSNLLEHCLTPRRIGPGLIVAVAMYVTPAAALQAQTTTAFNRQPDFIQKLGDPVPLNLTFQDESGKPVTLRQCMDGKPTILTLVYYGCPMLCTEVLNALARSLKGVSLSLGDDYRIVTVSFNSAETPDLAAQKKLAYLDRFGGGIKPDDWRFLTGREQNIRKLVDAVGFEYAYDPASQQYAHPAGIMVLTPDGRVNKYLLGVDYAPRDVQLALVDAAGGRIGTPVDQLLLLCYHYDPATGRYSLAILKVLRIGAVITIAGLAGIVFCAARSGKRRRKRSAAGDPDGLDSIETTSAE